MITAKLIFLLMALFNMVICLILYYAGAYGWFSGFFMAFCGWVILFGYTDYKERKLQKK